MAQPTELEQRLAALETAFSELQTLVTEKFHEFERKPYSDVVRDVHRLKHEVVQLKKSEAPTKAPESENSVLHSLRCLKREIRVLKTAQGAEGEPRGLQTDVRDRKSVV
jgi:hypothetical protein